MSNDKINKLLAEINKKYGKGTILPASEALSLVVDRIPFGVFDLDMKIGGGIPRGRVTVLKGEFSTGKSALTYKAAANAQRMCRFCCKPFEIITSQGEVFDIDCKCGAKEPMRVVILDAEHCLAEGTLVYESSEGRYVPVEELASREVFETLSFDSEGSFTKKAAKAKEVGEREVYEIILRGGRSIRLTDNHKVPTSYGYKEVSELLPGDELYTPVNIDNEPFYLADERYRLLGLHIGDGCHGAASISNIDPEIIDDIEKIVAGYGCTVTLNDTNVNIVSERLEYAITKDVLQELWDSDLYVSEIACIVGCGRDTMVNYLDRLGICTAFERRSRAARLKLLRKPEQKEVDPKFFAGRKNDIHLWLEQFECFNQYSTSRTLPKGLTKGQLAQVIAGIFMADGTSVDPERQKRALASFSTSSKRLAYDIQVALTRFGIYSSISLSMKEGYEPGYNVTLRGLEDVSKFLEVLPIYSYKRERLESAVATVHSSNRRSYHKNYIRLEILSVEKLDYPVKTFDVSLDEPNFFKQNFLSNGLIIHNSFDPQWVRRHGVCIEDLLVIQTEYAEQAIDVADACIRSKECDLLIVDSIAALTPSVEIQESAEKWQMGVMARLLGKAFRKWTSGVNSYGLLSDTKCTILMINQLRLALGGYHPTVTSPGGKAADFYQSLELRLKRKEEIVDKGSGRPVGVQVEFQVKKNKTFPISSGGQFALYFVAEKGKHRVGDTDTDVQVGRLGAYWGILKKAGAGWITFPDGTKAQGDEKAGAMLRDNPKLMNQIQDLIKERELAWQETGVCLDGPQGAPTEEASSEDVDD